MCLFIASLIKFKYSNRLLKLITYLNESEFRETIRFMTTWNSPRLAEWIRNVSVEFYRNITVHQLQSDPSEWRIKLFYSWPDGTLALYDRSPLGCRLPGTWNRRLPSHRMKRGRSQAARFIFSFFYFMKGPKVRCPVPKKENISLWKPVSPDWLDVMPLGLQIIIEVSNRGRKFWQINNILSVYWGKLNVRWVTSRSLYINEYANLLE